MEIDVFFAPIRYPEFADWTPIMSPADAARYVRSSSIKAILHHATFSDRAEAIRRQGVDITRSTPTVLFAAGHYLAEDAEYAFNFFGSEILPQMALIKNPFVVDSPFAFAEWLEDEGLNFAPERVRARAATLLLLDRGFDGMQIREDTPGQPHSEAWLAFHPKQVVTLSRG